MSSSAPSAGGAIRLRISDASSNKEKKNQDWRIDRKNLELGEVIGSGGYGSVHKGLWRHAPVAIKRYKKPVSRKALKGELGPFMKLNHPSIVRTYGLAYDADLSPWLVMEYLEKGHLFDYIQTQTAQGKPIDRLRILFEVALGMEFLHSKEILHLDLKPENVLIADGGSAKISDFGMSKLKGEAITRNVRDQPDATFYSGTAQYMAPERWKGKTGFEFARSDVFSFAMTAYAAFLGARPWGCCDVLACKVLMNAGERPERPEGQEYVDFGLTDRVWACIQQRWEDDPAKRPYFNEIVDNFPSQQTTSNSSNTYNMSDYETSDDEDDTPTISQLSLLTPPISPYNLRLQNPAGPCERKESIPMLTLRLDTSGNQQPIPRAQPQRTVSVPLLPPPPTHTPPQRRYSAANDLPPGNPKTFDELYNKDSHIRKLFVDLLSQDCAMWRKGSREQDVDRLLDGGVAEGLVKMLQSSEQQQPGPETILRSFARLATTEPHVSRILEAHPEVELARALTGAQSSPDALAWAVHAIGALSLKREYAHQLLKGRPQRDLAAIIAGEATPTTTLEKALLTMGRLAQDPAQAKQILEAYPETAIVAILERKPTRAAVEHAIFALTQLARGKTNTRQLLSAHPEVALTRLLGHKEDVVKARAAKAITSLGCSRNAAEKFAYAGALPLLGRLATRSADNSVREHATEAKAIINQFIKG